MSEPWLEVIGIGADGIAGVSEAARQHLLKARLVVGGERHLGMLQRHIDAETRAWSPKLDETLDQLQSERGRPTVAVVASGDPLWFGIGRRLLAHFNRHELRFHPHLSAFQLAATRLGWPIDGTACLSLHGRSLDRLSRELAPGRRLLLLTSDGEAPAAIGDLLRRAGYGRSVMTVFETLDGPDEGQISFRADEAAHRRFADLNTLAVWLEADRGAAPARSLTAGLDDEIFGHDGQLTKQEVRAITLSRLAPRPGQHLWDIGAGAGSIAIEWLLAGRAFPDLPTTATAIEANPDRVARIIDNAFRLGVPELQVIEGKAPKNLPVEPKPDAIFIGGGVGIPLLIEGCLAQLRPGGRLVANAVTLSGEARLLDFQRRHGGTLTRIAISRAEALGRAVGWKAMAPVTQWALETPRRPKL